MKKLTISLLLGSVIALPLHASTIKGADVANEKRMAIKADHISQKMKSAHYRIQLKKDQAKRQKMLQAFLDTQALKEGPMANQFVSSPGEYGGVVALKFLVEGCVSTWSSGQTYCNLGRPIVRVSNAIDQNLASLFRTMVDGDGDMHINHKNEVRQYAGVIDDMYRDGKRRFGRDLIRSLRFATILVDEALSKFRQGQTYFKRGRDLVRQLSDASRHLSESFNSMVDGDGDIHAKFRPVFQSFAKIIQELKEGGSDYDNGGGNNGGGGHHGSKKGLLSARQVRYLINMLENERDIPAAVRVLKRALRHHQHGNGGGHHGGGYDGNDGYGNNGGYGGNDGYGSNY